MLLAKRKLKKLVLVITDIANKDALERWQFDIETTADIEWDFDLFDSNLIFFGFSENGCVDKDEKRIKQEMSDVLRFAFSLDPGIWTF